MRSVQAAGTADFLFVPALVSLLRHRLLKGRARDVLVGYGEEVIDPLAHFLRDQDEDIWVRRHIPATLARIPSQRAVDVLVESLDDPDGFLRFKAIAGLERLRQSDANLEFPREPDREAHRPRGQPVLPVPLAARQPVPQAAASPPIRCSRRPSTQKMDRSRQRVYRLLSLIYPWTDIAAVRVDAGARRPPRRPARRSTSTTC
jgi:hypothetical protein